MGGGGGEEIHPPWRNERPDELEVGWAGAKAYGRRQDTEGPAAVNRSSADESSESILFLRGGVSHPTRRMPRRTRRGIVGPSPRWTTFPAAWRVASMVVGAKRSFWWKRGFDNRLCCWSSVTDGTMWPRKDSWDDSSTILAASKPWNRLEEGWTKGLEAAGNILMM